MIDLEFKELTKTRHSGYSYDFSKNIPLSAIRPLLEAAHLAPSCYNEQPWHFIVTHKTETPEAYKKIFDSLVPGNQKWANGVPILIAVVAKNYYRKNHKPNRHGPYDSGAAAISMALEAANRGYMAHQMGGFDENKLAASFGISSDYTPMSVMALGYEKEGEEIPPKDRRELKNHFYFGEWKPDHD